jgi:phosphomevalonate kinase
VFARAPGKIVLWGEYAVLAGAPAVIMAVDRYATIQMHARSRGWHFASRGFLTPSVHAFTGEFTGAPTAQFAEAALKAFGKETLVSPFSYTADTAAFFETHTTGHGANEETAARKLGIGSSAAVCTATYAAMARWLGEDSDFATALALHRDWQGGTGSGLDVAASWHGGVVRYEAGHGNREAIASALALPSDLNWQAVWTGTSVSTERAVRSFSAWRDAADTRTLDALVAAAQSLTEATNLDTLANYQTCLRGLDDAADLQIFTPEHEQLGKIAAQFGLVYKPCGAGGGDIGIAFGRDPDALTAFSRHVDDTPYQPLSLEIAQHGVEVSD